jgi:hypothetical protein
MRVAWGAVPESGVEQTVSCRAQPRERMRRIGVLTPVAVKASPRGPGALYNFFQCQFARLLLGYKSAGSGAHFQVIEWTRQLGAARGN